MKISASTIQSNKKLRYIYLAGAIFLLFLFALTYTSWIKKWGIKIVVSYLVSWIVFVLLLYLWK